MTDNQLLFYAAKAAGIDYSLRGQVPTRFDGKDFIVWNPLQHDGDALRLAVKLGLSIQPYYYYDERRQIPATATKSGGGMIEDTKGVFPTYQESMTPHDPYAATRRCIVRAAAEIGNGL
jgi:hypothetical protein